MLITSATGFIIQRCKMVSKELQDPDRLSKLRTETASVTAGDLMIDDFPTVSSDSRISDVLSVMKSTGYQDIPVVDDGEYTGMVSYSFILRKRSATLDSKVRGSVRNPATLSKTSTIAAVAEMMISTRSRQLPVLEGKKIVGLISRRSVVAEVLESGVLNGIKVHEIMNNPVVHVRSNDLLDTAVQRMIGGDYRTLPVVGSDGKVCGVLGMKEIIESNWKASRTIGDLQKVSVGSKIVENVATTSAVTVEWGDDLVSAAEIMVEKGFSSLPVIDSSGLVGIVTEFDITELISASRERESMYVQISGLEDDDKVEVDAIYEDIGNVVKKISKIYTPESMTMHVGRYNDDGDSAKYSVTGRLYINGKVVAAKAVQWDLLDAVNEVLRNMEATVIDMKDSVVSSRRRK